MVRGAVCYGLDNAPMEYFFVQWEADTLQRFHAETGNPALQSLWEFLTLLLVLVCWGQRYTFQTLLIESDNMAALNDAMKLKGRGAMNAVAREMAWRRVALQWHFRTKHLPKEINLLADALSRLHAAPPHAFSDVLQTCHRVNPAT